MSALIGREEDLVRLSAAAEGNRVVAVVGPGGIGKTRLVESWMRGRPAVFVSMADRLDDQDALQAIAEALGANLGATRGEASIQALGVSLSGREGWLILDAAEACRSLIERAVPSWAVHLRILITSRLEVAGADVLVPVGPLDPGSARELFLQRAPRQVPERHLPEVATLVERLGGSPLAIELVAARAGLAAPGQLLKQLGLAELSDVSGLRPTRHASLRAVVEASWAQLAPEDRELLSRVCAYHGPVTVEDVVDWAGDGAWGGLERLRAASLVAASDSDDGIVLRPYDEVLHVVREVAPVSRAARVELARSVIRRVMPIARARYTSRHLDGEPAFLRRLRDVIAAWELELEGVSTGFFDDPALWRQLALHLPIGRSQPLLERSLEVELPPVLRACLVVTVALGRRRSRRLAEARALLAKEERVNPDPGARAYLWLVRAFEELDRFAGPDRAEPLARAAEAAEALGAGELPQYAVAFGWRLLGIVRRIGGDCDGADDALFRALEIERAGDDLAGVASTLCQVAFSRAHADRPWRPFIEQALGCTQQIGDDPIFVSMVLQNQLHIQGFTGDFENFDEVAAMAERHMRARGDLDQVEHHAVTVALTSTLTRDPVSAAQAIESTLALVAQWKGRALYRELRLARAWCAHVQGELAEAGRWYEGQSGDGTNEAVPTMLALWQAERGSDPSPLYPAVRSHCPAAGVREALVALGAPDPGPLEVHRSLPRTRMWVDALVRRVALDPLVWVDPLGGYFVRDSDSVSLGRRKAARGVLAALATARRDSPGLVLELDELLEAGWPGERMHPDSARQRVYTVIHDLRSLGLDRVLENKGTGYVLDPATTRIGPYRPGP